MAELLQMAGISESHKTPQQKKAASELLLESLRDQLKRMICDNPVVSASKMSAKGMGELFKAFFGGYQVVKLELFVQALQSRLQQNTKGDLDSLTRSLQILLGHCAKQGESTSAKENVPPEFNRAADLGLDEFLGHDIEPTIFRDSAAYPTKIPSDNLSSSSVAKGDHPDSNKEPESFLVQDLILLTDFVGIPELINMVSFRDHKTLYR